MAIELPDIIELNEFGGDIDAYDDEIHRIYTDLFKEPKLTFNSRPVYPIIKPIQHKGRHFTYSHMTSVGSDEENREYDLRRCERICWVRPILESYGNTNQLRVWRQRRSSKERVIVWHEISGFLIVLDDRYKYYSLITTFIVRNKRKTEYLNEYNEYLSKVVIGEAKPI